MNLLFGTPTQLKAAILPESLRARTEWDSLLVAMAEGVATSMETYCRRALTRLVDDKFSFPADCSQVTLPRYPVETITGLEQRWSLAEGWRAMDLGAITNLDEDSGLVEFYGLMGTYQSRLRITYTGGYWVDLGTGTLPAGATQLPADLLSAWHLQCHHEVDRRDILRNLAAKKESDQPLPTVSKLELVPRVKEILQPYIRQ